MEIVKSLEHRSGGNETFLDDEILIPIFCYICFCKCGKLHNFVFVSI